MCPRRESLVEMGKKSPGGVPEQLFFGDRVETYDQAGTKAYIEDEGVVVVCGLAISDFESEDFSFSENVLQEGLKGQTLSEGAVDTTRPPQCEFSNLEKLPLTFQL